MRGGQDLGGLPGFGAVEAEANEPIFHAPWERRVLGFTLAMGATRSWTGDQSRHEREKLPERFYRAATYYHIWLEGLTNLMLKRAMVSSAEVASGHMQEPPKPVARVLPAHEVAATLAKGTDYSRPAVGKASLAVGQKVRTRKADTPGHTRLPGYASEKVGTVERIHGFFVYPDSSGMGLGDDPHWLYAVRFTAQELWGRATPDTVVIDLWEPYLEPL